MIDDMRPDLAGADDMLAAALADDYADLGEYEYDEDDDSPAIAAADLPCEVCHERPCERLCPRAGGAT